MWNVNFDNTFNLEAKTWRERIKIHWKGMFIRLIRFLLTHSMRNVWHSLNIMRFKTKVHPSTGSGYRNSDEDFERYVTFQPYNQILFPGKHFFKREGKEVR